MRYKYIILIVFISTITVYAKNYKGAELRTKQAYLYGRFEVRYKASWGSGQTSTFFTYNDDYPNTPWNEIDIEILGRYDDDVQFNTITNYQTNHLRHQFVNFNPGLDFHTYGIEWTPSYVAWFIDGIEVYRQTGEHISLLKYPQKIMMNIWNPAYSDWVGEFDDRTLPFFAYYDFVSYSSYTPGQGNCGTGNNFILQWTDEFDSFNNSRWQKATHTWNGNNSDFIQENCLFKDGKMILCLTDNYNTGYTDKNPPVVMWAIAADDSVIVRFSEDVTEPSAENLLNYVVPGAQVQSARLLRDQRTVVLRVNGMEKNTTYNLVCLGVKDQMENPNKLQGQNIPITSMPTIQFPFKINVGSNKYNDYKNDQAWDYQKNYGYEDGISHGTTQSVSGTDEDQIYRSWLQGLAAYRIRVPNGVYNIKMLFSENIFENSGLRCFDVYIENVLVIENLDIFKEVGKHAAHIEGINNVSVNDGIIDVHFSAVVNEPVLSGLIIEQVSTGIVEKESGIKEFLLKANYPNPFNNKTVIPIVLNDYGFVSLKIFNLNGRMIYSSGMERRQPGPYEFVWEYNGVSGIYVYRLDFVTKNGLFSYGRKMLYIK
ncbi:family 16 glycosylhydrolase [bacterium]|nr:family 16 glycosylhydrolase [bacterium]